MQTGARGSVSPSASCAAPADPPPACPTGVEMTAGVHWLRGTTDRDGESVIRWIAERLGESVVVLERASYGYSEAYQIGSVRVLEAPTRPDMGVCVEIQGQGCEELGLRTVAEIRAGLALRVSRLDLAIDGCPFTPAMLRDEWRAGNVRTRCKVPGDAREDRQWRSCDWRSKPTGDRFAMGSRTSTQYARCYDDRGFTRFELELKAEAAELAAAQLLDDGVAPGAFALGALSWVRRFVDFVDQDSTEHASRRPLLPFWEAFCGGVPKARVTLDGVLLRTVEQVRAWVEYQVAPALAVVQEALGAEELLRIVQRGRERWRPRHRAMLRASVVPV